MTKVFIGGSRHVSWLSADVRRRLDKIVEKRLPVLVGDANGADRAVQEYLRGREYDLVEVLCAGNACRNNLGRWSVRTVAVNGHRRDYSFYASKDRVMAEEADCGLMIWDGKSVGTLMNVLRLTTQRKPVVVYSVPEKTFSDLRTGADWSAFVSRCAVELRGRIEREWAAEQRIGHPIADARGVTTSGSEVAARGLVSGQGPQTLAPGVPSVEPEPKVGLRRGPGVVQRALPLSG